MSEHLPDNHASVTRYRCQSLSQSRRQPLTQLPFARVCLLAYTVLILYASWYPFTGWQANNLSALPDVIRQWPRYWTKFDAGINIVGYIPLGTLIVFALYPLVNRWWAALIACFGGALISASPNWCNIFCRAVTSLLDFLTNTSGAVLGRFRCAADAADTGKGRRNYCANNGRIRIRAGKSSCWVYGRWRNCIHRPICSGWGNCCRYCRNT
jgi:VanZ family protein